MIIIIIITLIIVVVLVLVVVITTGCSMSWQRAARKSASRRSGPSRGSRPLSSPRLYTVCGPMANININYIYMYYINNKNICYIDLYIYMTGGQPQAAGANLT